MLSDQLCDVGSGIRKTSLWEWNPLDNTDAVSRKFVSLTTKMLAQLWGLGAKYTHKRKRDKVTEDILAFSATRPDPISAFTEELEGFDPDYCGLPQSYRKQDEKGEVLKMYSLVNLMQKISSIVDEIYRHVASLYKPQTGPYQDLPKRPGCPRRSGIMNTSLFANFLQHSKSVSLPTLYM